MDDRYGGPERRQYRRVKASFMVNYMVRKPPEVCMSIGNKEVDAIMVDLSEGGMAITSSYDIPMATTLEMSFTLITPYRNNENLITRMQIEGNVVNRTVLEKDEYRLGIQFTRISQEDKTAIVEFVKLIGGRP